MPFRTEVVAGGSHRRACALPLHCRTTSHRATIAARREPSGCDCDFQSTLRQVAPTGGLAPFRYCCSRNASGHDVVRRRERGFAFPGYEMNAAGLTGVARPFWFGFVERVLRLYEQGASSECIGDSIRRWITWVDCGSKQEVAAAAWSTKKATL